MEAGAISVINCTTYQLLRQPVDQKPQILYSGSGDQFNVAGEATVQEVRKEGLDT